MHDLRPTSLAACIVSVLALSSPLAQAAAVTAATRRFAGDGGWLPLVTSQHLPSHVTSRLLDAGKVEMMKLSTSTVSQSGGAPSQLQPRRNALAMHGSKAHSLTLSGPAAVAQPLVCDPNTVTSCDDPKPAVCGTLRYAAAHAPASSTIDMTGLTCSLITLTQGEINVANDNVTIRGPGETKLRVAGVFPSPSAFDDRIFNDVNSGTLTLSDLSVSSGYIILATPPRGGCIYSGGALYLSHVHVYNCTASEYYSSYGPVYGGGVYAKGFLTLVYSQVSSSTAFGGYLTEGGGVFARGGAALFNSSIYGNFMHQSFVINLGPPRGGGLAVPGNLAVFNSTISYNGAGFIGLDGGVVSGSPSGNSIFELVNSTISGNLAQGEVGGVETTSSTVALFNSTIARNHVWNSTATNYSTVAGGLLINEKPGSSPVIVFQSSIIALNDSYFAQNESDLTTIGVATVLGANNLIQQSTGSTVPGDTITACPLLGPLRDNGGPTLTHALLSHSPGIDVGNNNLGAYQDQRGYFAGPGPYPRVSGVAADIGAYEVQQNDIIFNAGFDGCATY